MRNSESFLFYEDEDKILPLLLHAADENGYVCDCYDCQGLRMRMRQIELMHWSAQSEAS